MLIDWFTVGAQTLNFLILAWLLKRFLYKPILNAIDSREKSITKILTDASAKKAEALREHDEFQHKNEEFDRQRATLLQQATDEVKTERQRMLDEARTSADALCVKRQDALKNEQQLLNDEISRRTREEVFAIARKTLKDLAGTVLETRIVEVFAQRLRKLDNATEETLAKALNTSTDPVLVRSAFALSAEQQVDLQLAFKEVFAAKNQIHFETVPDLIGGIEFSVNGQKLAWSIQDYLGSLEKSIAELLPEKPEAK